SGARSYTLVSCYYMCLSFFFQAEDGIRDSSVTGVQTCALPISDVLVRFAPLFGSCIFLIPVFPNGRLRLAVPLERATAQATQIRSEERRVGKECRARCAGYQLKSNRREYDTSVLDAGRCAR